MSIEVKVFGIILDDVTKAPVVILKAIESEETLSIQVGFMEASAIAAILENVVPPRPMTHDLIKNFFTELNVTLKEIEIIDIKDNIFYAVIRIIQNGAEFIVDARPSDAIAIALRTKSPIFVHERVLSFLQPRDYIVESKNKWMNIMNFEKDDDDLIN